MHLALRMAKEISFGGKMRAYTRIVLLMVVLFWHLSLLIISSMIRGETEERGFRYRRKYTRAAMRILGVRLTLSGAVPDHPALYVSNHRSLLDPLIELRYINAYIVSKAEVDKYPLIGRGARETGVVFLTRESRESRAETRTAIRNLLIEGKSVLLYPEGTTSDFELTREFKLGAFQIAADVGVPIVPVAIEYGDKADHWADGSMLPFFIRKFAKRRIYAAMVIGEPIRGTQAVELMEEVRAQIHSEIMRTKESLPGNSVSMPDHDTVDTTI